MSTWDEIIGNDEDDDSTSWESIADSHRPDSQRPVPQAPVPQAPRGPVRPQQQAPPVQVIYQPVGDSAGTIDTKAKLTLLGVGAAIGAGALYLYMKSDLSSLFDGTALQVDDYEEEEEYESDSEEPDDEEEDE